MVTACATRAPLSALRLTELHQQGQRLADCLFALIRDDVKLVKAMTDQLESRHDYRTIIIAASLDRTRCSVDLYHRSELGMRHAELLKLVRNRARTLKLGMDTSTTENMQAHIDALLVPQSTWLFGAKPQRTGIAHLDVERLFPAAFVLQDLELSRYSKTIVLDRDQLDFLDEQLYLK